MHISSLPTPYGIGTMGREARMFVEFLVKAKQKYWQILPVCPTGYGDSPYQSFSTFAGNPYFIDLTILCEEGLLEEEEYNAVDWGQEPGKVDFGRLYQKRYPLLRKAATRFLEEFDPEYDVFCKEQAEWLDEYALFMTLKMKNNGSSWLEWPEKERCRDPKTLSEVKKAYEDEYEFWKVVQYLFFVQWKQLKEYANVRGIEIIGDLPIYVAMDSADVWANPKFFQLDEELIPINVAGCPPDGFSSLGQLWGNPLFNWTALEKEQFSWWIKRIEYSCNIYDVLRLDHFRGFESYYAIPYGNSDARGGHWEQGPGKKLFAAIKRQIGDKKIIAEDLGFLTESVRELLDYSGFPGMKVFELGFDSRDKNGSEYVPHNFVKNCVAYTGTHDNDTIQGWLKNAPAGDVAYAMEYMNIGASEDGHWQMMKALWSTVADTVIVQAQDLLGLGSESRMNTPSTMGQNWTWRAEEGAFSDELAEKLAHYAELYSRA